MTDKLALLESLLVELPLAVDRRKLGDRLKQSADALRLADHQVGRINAVLELADLTEFGRNNLQKEVLESLQDEAWHVGKALSNASTDSALRDAVDEYQRSLPAVI